MKPLIVVMFSSIS